MDATEAVEAAPDTETSEPVLNDAGFAMHGDYPLNGRLRAEALADAGEKTDPEGIVSDDLIAATAKRVKAEAADAPSLSWSKMRLIEHAEGMGLIVEGDANKPTILSQINAGAPASAEG